MLMRRGMLAGWMVVALAWSGAVGAGGAPVPQSGARESQSTGDDGALRRGVAWSPETRFLVNDDGTVTDTLTGLIWMKNVGCLSGSQGKTWSEALSS
ncbi:MAG: DUF1566 domain-containing protein, partial [Magnetococcus sp. WYHC-3]